MPQGAQTDRQWDSSDFEEQFHIYEADLYRYARYLAHSSSFADDIYQDTWLRVARHLNDGRPIENFKKFLFTVATNIYRDELKKIRVRRFFLGASLDDKNQDDTIWVATQDNPPMLNDALQQSLARLSERQRSMFCLSYIEGFKISEISKMMNCAQGTVKATIYKAVQKLRQDLNEFRE